MWLKCNPVSVIEQVSSERSGDWPSELGRGWVSMEWRRGRERASPPLSLLITLNLWAWLCAGVMLCILPWAVLPWQKGRKCDLWLYTWDCVLYIKVNVYVTWACTRRHINRTSYSDSIKLLTFRLQFTSVLLKEVRNGETFNFCLRSFVFFSNWFKYTERINKKYWKDLHA